MEKKETASAPRRRLKNETGWISNEGPSFTKAGLRRGALPAKTKLSLKSGLLLS